MWKLILRYIKFGTSTLAGTLVDTLVLWFFAHLVFSGYVGQNIISPAISFECAMFTNYTLAYFYVWKDRIEYRTKGSFLKRLAGYNLSCIMGFLIKMAFLLFFKEVTHLDVVWCNLIALCFSGIFNFAINEYVVFSKRFTKK